MSSSVFSVSQKSGELAQVIQYTRGVSPRYFVGTCMLALDATVPVRGKA